MDYQKIRELYDTLPAIECQGKCWNFCAGIYTTPAENNAIRRRKGVRIPEPHEAFGNRMVNLGMPRQWASDVMQNPMAIGGVIGKEPCPLLDRISHRCNGYQVRPMICRLWGLTERMKCPHGCQPSRVLDDREELWYIFTTEYHGGDMSPEQYESFISWLDDPELYAWLEYMTHEPGTRAVCIPEIESLLEERGMESPWAN